MATIDRFYDGEPVDITKLNQIVDAIIDINKKSPNLSSSTVLLTPEVWSGQGKITTGAKAGAITEATINYADANFSAIPAVTVTPIINTGASGNSLTMFVKSVTKSQAVVAIHASGKLLSKDINFSYIAVSMKSNK